jgi:hypothetical protein
LIQIKNALGRGFHLSILHSPGMSTLIHVPSSGFGRYQKIDDTHLNRI